MNILLDTHVLLWWLQGSAKMTPAASKIISASENTVFVSAVSVWELRIKELIKKVTLPKNFSEVLEHEQFEELKIGIAHAHLAGALPLHHRDPFDRMLIAQAKIEELLFVSHDPVVAKYGVDHLLV